MPAGTTGRRGVQRARPSDLTVGWIMARMRPTIGQPTQRRRPDAFVAIVQVGDEVTIVGAPARSGGEFARTLAARAADRMT